MKAKTFTSTLVGLEGALVEIEAAKSPSLPSLRITGLPNDVIKESRDRIIACLNYLGFSVPTQKVIVHLSPAAIKKQGSHFDLAISMAFLTAENLLQITSLEETAFLGELTLDGRVKKVSNIISLIEVLERNPKIQNILIPKDNAKEASLIQSQKSKLVGSLSEAIGFCEKRIPLDTALSYAETFQESVEKTIRSLDQVLGQNLSKRALMIALSGRHHLLLVGPPGMGKSMLAETTPFLLPELSTSELIEISKIYGCIPPSFKKRPFRSPHHTVSASGLLGGGSGHVVVGEVSLSHCGVLFLDEFSEFRRDAIEGLREPLQAGFIHVDRVGHTAILPSRFTLIAAMNPCPCGYAYTPYCKCLPDKVQNYRKKISGPVLDRIDLLIVLSFKREKREIMSGLRHDEIKEKILRTIEIQQKRYQALGSHVRNGEIIIDEQMEAFYLEKDVKDWFEYFSTSEHLSHRAVHKIIKVARTIADIEECSLIQKKHLREAIELRCPDSYARA